MNDIRIAVIDDSPADSAALTALLCRYLPSAHICRYDSAEAFLTAYEDAPTPAAIPALLLLDVEMRGMSGIDLARRLREQGDRTTEIIFTTSHPEFIAVGYEVDALHYLIKPIRAHQLQPALDRALENLRRPTPAVILTMTDGDTLRLPVPEILYLEAALHETIVHTSHTVYRTKTAFSAVLAQCTAAAPGALYRCHRSYAVSLAHIRRITRHTVSVTETELPLARGRYEEINRMFIAYFS